MHSNGIHRWSWRFTPLYVLCVFACVLPVLIVVDIVRATRPQVAYRQERGDVIVMCVTKRSLMEVLTGAEVRPCTWYTIPTAWLHERP